MSVTLMFFGRLRERAGRSSVHLTLPDHVSDTTALRRWADQHCGLDGALLSTSVQIAVNEEIAHGGCPVRAGDEIAFMPPVSGG